MADLSDDQSLPSAGDVTEGMDDTGFSEAERAEILNEIESLVSDTRAAAPLDKEFLRPRRSGVWFPILINLFAASAIAAGIYFISQYFQVREENIAVESRSFFSAEAQIIEELLRESEQRLAQKDQEIGQIENQLAQLDLEKQNLEANLEGQVQAREAELRAELQAELDAERQRLADEGQSEDEISARLEQIEAARQQEYAAAIDAFRDEAAAELQQREAELAALESQLEQTLTASQEERLRLADEVEQAAEREAQLREELGAEIEALEEAEQQALAQISELQQLREEESLLADRVLGSFAVIVQDIQEGLSEEALSGLDSLERLLQDETASSGDRERQRRTELSLATTLRGLVQEVDVLRDNIAVRDLTTSADETTELERQRATELIQTAADVVQLAEVARNEGRYSEARSLYQQALATIPSLEVVYPGILELESRRRQTVLQSALLEAQNLLSVGSTEAAVTRYLEAVREIAADAEDPLLEIAAGIQDATSQNQDELLAVQASIESEYRDDLSARDGQISTLNQQLLASRNSVADRESTIASLQEERDALQEQIDSRQASLQDRSGELAAAEAQIVELEDEIASLTTDLQSEQARTTGLQSNLETQRSLVAELEASEAELQEQIRNQQTEISILDSDIGELESEAADLNSQISDLTAQVADLRTQIAERPEIVTEISSDEPSADVQAELDRLTRELELASERLTEQETEITKLQGELDTAEADLQTTTGELQTAKATIRSASTAGDELQTELTVAQETIASLNERIDQLEGQRDSATGDTAGLEAEIEELEQEVADLSDLQDRVNDLTRRYNTARTAATSLYESENYGGARTRLLSPFITGIATELVPGFVNSLNLITDAIVAGAESATTEETRTVAYQSVAGLADLVQRNIDSPQDSAAVESYLTRFPELAAVADEIFEIVELATRDISAPEIEYKLLGSVSRVTGNLIVVERLVALPTEVGDVIEIRRTPQLGQEIPIAKATVLEVTERRVLVSVGEIYQISEEPDNGDLVYVAQD